MVIRITLPKVIIHIYSHWSMFLLYFWPFYGYESFIKLLAKIKLGVPISLPTCVLHVTLVDPSRRHISSLKSEDFSQACMTRHIRHMSHYWLNASQCVIQKCYEWYIFFNGKSFTWMGIMVNIWTSWKLVRSSVPRFQWMSEKFVTTLR